MMRILEKQFQNRYIQALNKLEQYGYYCLRCLHRAGIHPQPTDFTLVAIQRHDNTIAEALVYPSDAVTKKGINNPMFFYGFYFQYDFKDLEYPYRVVFSENIDRLV